MRISRRPPLHRWELRRPNSLFLALALGVGGPLNPVVWWLGWFEPGKPHDVGELLYILMIPSTIMSCTALIVLKRKKTFLLSDLVEAVLLGWAIAVAAAPLSVALGVSIEDGYFDFESFVPALLTIGFLGWLFGVIPYFAVTHGIPCSIALFVAVLGLSRRVQEHERGA